MDKKHDALAEAIDWISAARSNAPASNTQEQQLAAIVAAARAAAPDLFAGPCANGPNDAPTKDPQHDDNRDTFRTPEELLETMRRLMPELFPHTPTDGETP
jgi:hypothetical protein